MAREASLSSLLTTMDAMLRQESVYFQEDTNNQSNTINDLMPCLENIREVCRLRHHDTLVIATSYLSRYLQTFSTTTATSLSNHATSRVALVCLFIACKIHEPAALPLRTLEDLHRRFFPRSATPTTMDTAAWEQLEINVCEALAWRLHPPMASAFVDQLLPTHDDSARRKLRRKAVACLETVFKAQPKAFVERHKASDLAKAALRLSSSGSPTAADVNPKALSFLKEWRRVNNSNTPASTPSSLSSSKKKAPRKRCVTPTHPSPPEPSQKRPRTTLSPSTRNINIGHSPCLIWTGSPRSALPTEGRGLVHPTLISSYRAQQQPKPAKTSISRGLLLG